MEKLSVKELKEKLNELEKEKWLTKDEIKECLTHFNTKAENGILEFKSPLKQDIFNAFSLFPLSETRILIIGQDPYPDEDRAHGFAFSFKNGQKPADDSLLNIFKAIAEYRRNKGISQNNDIYAWNTNLEEWAKTNKVLLLNTALTYKKEENHFKIWNNFIKQIIKELIEKKPKNHKLAVFLWGLEARKIFYCAIKEKCPKSRQIKDYPNNTTNNIKIYITGHPTPSYNIVNRYGFSEDAPKHFAACDEFLGKKVWLNFPKK